MHTHYSFLGLLDKITSIARIIFRTDPPGKWKIVVASLHKPADHFNAFWRRIKTLELYFILNFKYMLYNFEGPNLKWNTGCVLYSTEKRSTTHSLPHWMPPVINKIRVNTNLTKIVWTHCKGKETGWRLAQIGVVVWRRLGSTKHQRSGELQMTWSSKPNCSIQWQVCHFIAWPSST